MPALPERPRIRREKIPYHALDNGIQSCASPKRLQTQILDRPVSGRIFFEDVIRENLDIGRPKQVQLIFDRVVTKTTPVSFRTRVITDG